MSMPAFYWKHNPIDAPVVSSTNQGEFFIAQTGIDEPAYICIVYKGKCWAGRKIINGNMNNNYRARVICADISDDETGKQILLKHFLLGK